MFTNDILIFIRVIPSNSTLLSLYQESFRQHLNLKKSLIFMGKRNHRSFTRIKVIFNFRSASFPSHYLGASLLLGCPWCHHFDSLFAKIRKKLDGWLAHSLSFSGKMVLVKHVLASILLHIAMVLSLPISVCKTIESSTRNFLWSTAADKSKASYVSWDKVYLPKGKGDLGI